MLHNIKKIKTELLIGVENLVAKKKISYLEAALLYCEDHNIDLEQAATILQTCKKITLCIESDARELNFLKK